MRTTFRVIHVLAVYGLALSSAVQAQTVPTQTVRTNAPGIAIKPKGYTTDQMFIRALNSATTPVKASTLSIQNQAGDISIVLPSTGGKFGVGKTTTSGGAVSILDIVPGATDTATLWANTTIQGALTVNGPLQFEGANSLALASTFPGSVTLGAGPGTAASNYLAIAIGGRNNIASGESSVVIGGDNYSNEFNLASGRGAVIIGGSINSTNSAFSNILGSVNSHILGADATRYTSIVGGTGNNVSADSGYGNALLGGSGNSITSDSFYNVIAGGMGSSITGPGSWRNALVGGQSVTAQAATNGFATGLGSIVTGNAQSVVGKWNISSADKALIIGNGTSDSSRSNAVSVDWKGTLEATAVKAGNIMITAPRGNISMGAFTDDQ